MNWTFFLKLIVTLLTFAIAAIEFNFFKKINNESLRKRWIGILFISLILFTIWDSTKESIDNSKEEKRRDSLIKVDSIRASKIIFNIENSLKKLDTTNSLISLTNESLKIVSDSSNKQITIINKVLKNTKNSSRIQKQQFKYSKPRIRFYNINQNITFNHIKNQINSIKLDFTNSGGRIAYNFVNKFKIIHYDKNLDQFTNIESYPSGIKHKPYKEILPYNMLGGYYTQLISLKPYNKVFLKEDIIIININMIYDDINKKHIKQQEYIIAKCTGKGEFETNLKQDKIFMEKINQYLKTN